MRKRNNLAVPLVFCLFALPIIAQDSDELMNLSLEDLMSLEIVSATRSKSKLSDSPVPISVITAKDIESTGLDNLPDILERLAEVDVLRIGASQVEVSIRGKGINFNRRLLVLVDGRTEYNDLFGVTFWNAFPLSVDDIERIEVVRGPASAVFGANAFSGVINIITKSGDSDLDSGVRAQMGTHKHQMTEVLYNYHNSKFFLKVSGGTTQADSAETAVSFEGFNRIPTTNNFVDDEDSLDMNRVSGQIGYKFNSKWDAKLSMGSSSGDMELFPQPGLPRAKWEVETKNAYLTLNYVANEKNSLQLNAYLNKFEYETPLLPTTAEVLVASGGHAFYPSLDEAHLFEGNTETKDVALMYIGNRAEGKANIVAGLQSRTIENSGGLVDNSDKDIQSIFANLTYKFGKDKWSAGLGYRYDKDSITGGDTGYTAGLSFFPKEGQILRLSTRRAFRAPSLFELYSRIDFNVPNQNHRIRFRGNSNLNVETIDTVDMTYTMRLGSKWQMTAEIYYEKLKDLIGNPDSGLLDEIEFDPSTNQFITTTSFQNLADADSKGGQMELVYRANDKLSGYANYRYADPKGLNDLSGETFFTPETKFNLGASWRVDHGFVANLDLHHVGETDPSEFHFGNTAPEGPNFTKDNQEAYTTINIKLGYKLNVGKGLEIYAMGTNIAGDDHVEYYEYDAVLKAVGERVKSEWVGGASWKF